MINVKDEYLVDPINVTNFHSSKDELELALLFWVCAAGKNAKSAAKALSNFLHDAKDQGPDYGYFSPFSLIELLGDIYMIDLAGMMKHAGIGCYNNKAKTFLALAGSGLNLETCSVSDLEKIRGIGPKTARGFVMHTRPNQRVACLDVHILRWLNDQGYSAPKTTPTGNRYLKIEAIFLNICDEKGMLPSELDLKIWNTYSGNKKSL